MLVASLNRRECHWCGVSADRADAVAAALAAWRVVLCCGVSADQVDALDAALAAWRILLCCGVSAARFLALAAALAAWRAAFCSALSRTLRAAVQEEARIFLLDRWDFVSLDRSEDLYAATIERRKERSSEDSLARTIAEVDACCERRKVVSSWVSRSLLALAVRGLRRVFLFLGGMVSRKRKFKAIWEVLTVYLKSLTNRN